MKIAIDATRAVIESAGIGRYTHNLVKKMLEIDQKNQYLLIFSYFRSDTAKEKLIKSFQRDNVEIKKLRIPGSLKEKIWGTKMPILNGIVKDADVFYAPSIFEVNLGLKIPQVLTIYDLTTFLFSEHRGKEVSERLNRRTREVVKSAKKIIAISEATKSDLIKILKTPPAKIQVIYPGKNDLGEPAKKLPRNLGKNSYILAVGTIEPRKNLIGLFKAYALLPKHLQIKFPLVVVGAKGWNTGETFEALKTMKLADKVKFLGFLSPMRFWQNFIRKQRFFATLRSMKVLAFRF